MLHVLSTTPESENVEHSPILALSTLRTILTRRGADAVRMSTASRLRVSERRSKLVEMIQVSWLGGVRGERMPE